VRQHPFADAKLSDEDMSVNFADVTTPRDRVAVIVTEPLTANEIWIPFTSGELKVFVGGMPITPPMPPMPIKPA
ncbi:MAG: yafJ, partial [Rhizobacter sp.]|nr:yafJ [Rhizobacter sp.]